MDLKKKLIMINVPSNNPDKARQFYEKFLGIEMATSLNDQNESYHAPLSQDGIDLIINPRHNAQEQITAYYAVDNLDEALRDAQQSGARVVWGPESLPLAAGEKDEYKQLVQQEFPNDGPASDLVGRGVLLVDPDGNSVGLVQLEKHAWGHFKAGSHRQPLDDKQVKIHQKSMQLGNKHKERLAGKR